MNSQSEVSIYQTFHTQKNEFTVFSDLETLHLIFYFLVQQYFQSYGNSLYLLSHELILCFINILPLVSIFFHLVGNQRVKNNQVKAVKANECVFTGKNYIQCK